MNKKYTPNSKPTLKLIYEHVPAVAHLIGP